MSAQPVAPAAAAPERRRVMGFLDVTLFMVAAILVVDQLTATASIGVSSIGWWVLTIVIFFVPSALIVAELGTAYPRQGGIYEWVELAFGKRWAARTTYWYWVNVALWMPSVYLLFTGVLVGLFWSGATIFQQCLVAVALTWITVAIGLQRLDIGKLVTNLGAAIKIGVILTIGIGGIVLAARHGSANRFSVHAMLPSFDVAKTYLPVLVYQLLGFELVSSLSGEMKHPRRDVARAILISGGVLSVLYVVGTVGMLLVLPVKQIGLTVGLIDTFKAIFGAGSPLPWILGLAVMAAYLGNMVTWTLGSNRSAVEASKAGELPKVLGTETRRGTPKGAFILTGVVGTAVLLFAGSVITSENDLYYALFAASSVIFLLPYLLMFPAVIRLRRTAPVESGPFRVPGGRVGLWTAVLLSTASIVAAVVLFLWTPGEPIAWSYTGPLLTIVVAAIVVGEVIVVRCLGWPHRRAQVGPTINQEVTS